MRRFYKIISVSRSNQHIEVEYHDDALVHTQPIPFPHDPSTVHDDILRHWPARTFAMLGACNEATEAHLNENLNVDFEIPDNEPLGEARYETALIPVVRLGAK